MYKQTNILLETGTNEFELVEFLVEEKNGKTHSFGINVGKVREIIKTPKIVEVPKAHPCVEGIADLRGKIIPMINLPKWLEIETEKPLEKVIITEFNNTTNGFLVNNVTRIYRISWKDLMQPEELNYEDKKNCVTSIAKIDDKMILILDFEKIVGDIFPELYFTEEKTTLKKIDRKIRTLIAEDSTIIRKLVNNALKDAGYIVSVASDGEAAYNQLLEILKKAKEQNRSVKDFIDILITDLEMPKMDGAHLIKKVREIPEFDDLPIIVFSSMGTEENKKKLMKLGANDFISKPDVNILQEAIFRNLK